MLRIITPALLLLLNTTFARIDWKVSLANGQCQIQSAEKNLWEKVLPSQQLKNKDVLKTGFNSKIYIEGQKNNWIMLGPNTKVLIDWNESANRVILNITSFHGSLLCQVQDPVEVHLTSPISSTIGQNAIVNISVSRENGSTFIQNIQGHSIVKNISSKKGTTLERGEITEVYANYEPETPSKISQEHLKTLKRFYGDEVINNLLFQTGFKEKELPQQKQTVLAPVRIDEEGLAENKLSPASEVDQRLSPARDEMQELFEKRESFQESLDEKKFYTPQQRGEATGSSLEGKVNPLLRQHEVELRVKTLILLDMKSQQLMEENLDFAYDPDQIKWRDKLLLTAKDSLEWKKKRLFFDKPRSIDMLYQTALNSDLFQHLFSLQPKYAYKKISLKLNLSFSVDKNDGLKMDLSSLPAIFDKIGSLQYGKLTDRFFVYLGRLENMTLSDGLLVSHYSNSIALQPRQKFGFRLVFENEDYKFHCFTNDILNWDIIGLHLIKDNYKYYFGGSLIVDQNQEDGLDGSDQEPFQRDLTSPPPFVRPSSVSPLYLYEAGFAVRLLSDVRVRSKFYFNFAQLIKDHKNEGYGVTVPGIELNTEKFYGFIEANLTQKRFISGYFDNFYEAERAFLIHSPANSDSGEILFNRANDTLTSVGLHGRFDYEFAKNIISSLELLWMFSGSTIDSVTNSQPLYKDIPLERSVQWKIYLKPHTFYYIRQLSFSFRKKHFNYFNLSDKLLSPSPFFELATNLEINLNDHWVLLSNLEQHWFDQQHAFYSGSPIIDGQFQTVNLMTFGLRFQF